MSVLVGACERRRPTTKASSSGSAARRARTARRCSRRPRRRACWCSSCSRCSACRRSRSRAARPASVKWAALQLGYMTTLAYVFAFVTFQGLRWVGSRLTLIRHAAACGRMAGGRQATDGRKRTEAGVARGARVPHGGGAPASGRRLLRRLRTESRPTMSTGLAGHLRDDRARRARSSSSSGRSPPIALGPKRTRGPHCAACAAGQGADDARARHDVPDVRR